MDMDGFGQGKDQLDIDGIDVERFDVPDSSEPLPTVSEREELLTELVERANDLFIVVDRKGMVQFVNHAFCFLTGQSREDVVGKRLVYVLDPNARLQAQHQLTHALQSGGRTPVDLPLLKKDGSTAEISFRPSADRAADGTVERMVLVGQSPFLYGELAEQFNSLNRDLRNYSIRLEELNAELEARIEQRTARLAALFEVSASLNAELQLDALFEMILRMATETIPGAEAGALLLHDEATDRLVVQAACGYQDPAIIQDLQTHMERVHPESIFADREVRVWSGDTKTDKLGRLKILLRNVDQFRIRSAVSAPIATPSERLGVLMLHNFDELHAFTDEDVQLVASLASSAAVAIINARLYEETRQQAERLELVNRLSAAVRDSADLDETLKLAIEGLGRALDASRAMITLFDETLDTASYAAHYVEPGVRSMDGQTSFLLGTPFVREMLGFREPRAVVDTRLDPRLNEARQAIEEFSVESLVAAPLVVRDRLIGVVELHQCDGPRRWRPSETNLIESIAKQVATAIHQNRLHAKLRDTVRESAQTFERETLVNRITTAIRASLDIDRILQTTVDQLGAALGASRCWLVMVSDPSLPAAEPSYQYFDAERSGSHVEGVSIPVAPSARIQTVLTGGGHVATTAVEAADSQLPPEALDVAKRIGIRSMLTVGIQDADGPIGFFSIQQCDGTRQWAAWEITLVRAVADQAAIAIRQASLFERISKSKQEWESTFDAMSDAVFIFDADKQLSRANSAASALDGRSFAELMGVRCCDILADLGEHECMVERAMTAGERLTFEWSRGVHTTYSITVDPLVARSGRGMGAVAVVRDLSPLRRAERESLRHKEFLSHLVENAYDVIGLLGVGGRIVWHNRSMSRVTGYDAEALEGMSFLDLIPLDKRGDAYAVVVQAEQGTPQVLETTIVDRSSHARDLLLTVTAVYEEGRVSGVLAIGRDVTDEKRAAYKAAEADKLRALGQLASGVAHDFNNMLAAILGRAQILKRQTDDERFHRGLDIIETAANDGARTVKRIQTFAHQRADVELRAVDVNLLVEDAIEITRTRWRDDAQSRGIQYRISFEPTVPTYVFADQSELREVFVNLILNALDAMPSGGKLRIAVSAVTAKASVVVTFADTGIGMPEGVRQRIFEPFFTTKGEHGTGLGLAVSYSIVNRHNGRIEVESELGAGTTMMIVLPVVSPTATKLPSAPLPVTRELRVLVVDDEDTVRDVLVEMLEAHGHSVVSATGGAEGLEKLAEIPYDVVFTDLSMPEMDGWAVAREVKRRRPGLKVVLVTGYAGTLEPETEILSHVDAVLGKPFDFDRVGETLREVTES
jgi:PAS domain S-box-containing protein